MEILKVEDLSFSYQENIDVLKDLSFSLVKGEYVCMIGPNGSGKSTIAKLVLGLLAAKKGKIFIEGEELTLKNLTLVRDKVGIVFQNPDNQFIGSTVEDDIAFGLENHQVESDKMPDIINRFASVVKMEEFLKFEPSRLSGGQKQRVAIAGVLAMNPELVIFDEATSMLDPIGKNEILSLIYQLKKKHHKTILSITHDMEEICAADKVLVLDQGKIVFSGTPLELLENEEILKSANLKLPFVAELVQHLNKNKKIIDMPLDLEELTEKLWQLNLKK